MVKQNCILTSEVEDIPCGLVLRSIGYRSHQIDPNIPFNGKRGVVDNVKGRVNGVPGVC